MDWSLVISACALALSAWSAFSSWKDHRAKIFVSDLFITNHTNPDKGEVWFRFDFSVTSGSLRPIPVTSLSVSTDKERWYDCALRSPTQGAPDSFFSEVHSLDRRVSQLFASPIELPATLLPWSAQHMSRWLCLPCNDELTDVLLGFRKPCAECRSSASSGSTFRDSLEELFPSQAILHLRFVSGNRMILSHVPICKESFLLLDS